MIKSAIFKTVILFSVLTLLSAGLLVACGNDTEEQAAIKERQVQNREQANIQPAPENQPGQRAAGENLVGKPVVGSDGEMLGTVAEIYNSGEESGYAIIQGEADRLHPVPADLLKEDPQGMGLRADFDRHTFQQSPSFSEAERQQWSDSRLQGVRGYYKNKAGENKMPGNQNQENQKQPGTGTTGTQN